MAVARWSFDTVPHPPRAPHVLLVAFSCGPLAQDIPLSLSRFGIPDAAALGALTLRSHTRASAPEWFDAWRTGSIRALAERDLGSHVADLDAADHAHSIVAAPQAPDDLGYLQASWGVARHFAERGATVVLDAHAATFHVARELEVAPLDVAAQVRIIFETDASGPDGAHAIHTRGLRKFGAADLIAHCGPDDAALVGAVMRRLAEAIARGADFDDPRHAITVPELRGDTWYLVDDDAGLAHTLALNNGGRVLVDAHGRSLLGARALLTRAVATMR